MPHSITGHIVVVDISNFLLLFSIPHSLRPQPASLIIGVFTCWDDPNLHFWSDWNVCHPSFIVCVFISLLNFPWTRLIYLLLLWIIIRYGNTKRSPRGSLVFLPPLGLYSKTQIYTWQLESINPPSTLTLYFTCWFSGMRGPQQLSDSLNFILCGTIATYSGGSISLLGIRTFKHAELGKYRQNVICCSQM